MPNEKSGKRAARKEGRNLRVRHEAFRNRVLKLLIHEDRWMSSREIWDAFFDGHPSTLTRTGEKSSMRHIPNIGNGAMNTVLRRDGRFKYRYIQPEKARFSRHGKQQEFKVDYDEIEN